MGLIKAANAPIGVVRYPLRNLEAETAGILDRARMEAEAIIAEAQARAGLLDNESSERGQADGWRQGYNEGQLLGRQEAMDLHACELRSAIEALQSAALAFATSRDELEAAVLNDVVGLAIAIAERITRRAGIVDPAVLSENLREAMKLVVQGSTIRIAVHPSQITLLDNLPADMRLDWPALKNAEIVPDETLTPGGCRISTKHGQIDADLQTQLDRIAIELLPNIEAGAS